MKKFFLVMGAFCVSAAIVSCVDDSESDEIKDLRQVQLDQKKVELDQKKVDLQQKQAALENTYWNNYDKAVAAVKTLQGDLNTAQQNLDGVKSGKLTHEAANAAAIAYQNTVIARNQKDIKDKETEISVQKSMKGKSYEEIQQATITAENAEELAIKDAQDAANLLAVGPDSLPLTLTVSPLGCVNSASYLGFVHLSLSTFTNLIQICMFF